MSHDTSDLQNQFATDEPTALLLGVTRQQLRLFAASIEQAGYRVLVHPTFAALTMREASPRIALLVCNRDLGAAAILQAYRRIKPHPRLLLLDADHALPQEGFALAERQPCTPDRLYHLLVPASEPSPLLESPLPNEQAPDAIDTPPMPTLAETLPPSPAAPVPVAPPPAKPAPAPLHTTAGKDAAPPATADSVPASLMPEPHAARRRYWFTGLSVIAVLILLVVVGFNILEVDSPISGPTVPPTPSMPRPASVEPTEPASSSTSGNTDLTVEIVAITPPQPLVNDIVNVRVQVRNIGTQDVRTPFWVDLYVAPHRHPAVNLTWETISSYGSTWQVERLAAGETRWLDTLDADPARSNLLRFSSAERVQLYALVDSYGQSQEGEISEQNERNNLSNPFAFAVGESASQ